MKAELFIFIVSFVLFASSSTYIGLNQEPAKGVTAGCSSDEIVFPDSISLEWMVLVVSLITMICSGILLHYEIKERYIK